VEGAVPETLKLPSDIEQVFARPNGEQSRRALEFDWLKKERERAALRMPRDPSWC
jgi:hypothetical protein